MCVPSREATIQPLDDRSFVDALSIEHPSFVDDGSSLTSAGRQPRPRDGGDPHPRTLAPAATRARTDRGRERRAADRERGPRAERTASGRDALTRRAPLA